MTSLFKQGAKLQQARLIGASDAVNKRRGALAPAEAGGEFLSTTDGRMAPAAYRGGRTSTFVIKKNTDP